MIGRSISKFIARIAYPIALSSTAFDARKYSYPGTTGASPYPSKPTNRESATETEINTKFLVTVIVLKLLDAA